MTLRPGSKVTVAAAFLVMAPGTEGRLSAVPAIRAAVTADVAGFLDAVSVAKSVTLG